MSTADAEGIAGLLTETKADSARYRGRCNNGSAGGRGPKFKLLAPPSVPDFAPVNHS